jgi:hypothetical protein
MHAFNWSKLHPNLCENSQSKNHLRALTKPMYTSKMKTEEYIDFDNSHPMFFCGEFLALIANIENRHVKCPKTCLEKIA